MSLLPYLINMERQRRHPDQHYAIALTPEDILSIITPSSPYLYHPWNQHRRTQLSSGLLNPESTIKTDSEKFQVNLDVQHFAPEEISVKTADMFVVIEGRHEERKDEHGWVARQFTRRYALPEGCDVAAVETRLSSDGVLTVTAPLKRPEVNERVVPIIQTGPVKTQAEKADGSGELVEAAPVGNEQ